MHVRMAIVSTRRNSTTITATAEHEVYIYKSVILYLDGLIRRYRVLALTVWGPLLPSPIFRTRGGGVMIQTVEAVNSMSLSKGNRIWWLSRPIVRSHPCAPSVCKLLLQYPGPFYHRYTFPRLILRR